MQTILIIRYLLQAPPEFLIPGMDLSRRGELHGPLLNTDDLPETHHHRAAAGYRHRVSHSYYRLGVKVTVVEMQDGHGPLARNITDFVETELKKKGVDLVLGQGGIHRAGAEGEITPPSRTGQGYGGGRRWSLMAGRAPNQGCGTGYHRVKMDGKGARGDRRPCTGPKPFPGSTPSGTSRQKMQFGLMCLRSGYLVD